eukprot:1494702-Alexandrium_andersonii.AAC.1
MLLQHRPRDVHGPRGWRRPHTRLRCRRILGHTRGDLWRSAVRTLGPGPPRPGSRPEVPELLPAPAFGEG